MPDGRASLGLCRGRIGPCGGWRARPGQRPGAEQGAADDCAAGEDARGPPERGVVAVRQRQPGDGLAADGPGRGEMRGEVGGDGADEDGVQQRGADREAELLADGDSRGGDAGVLQGSQLMGRPARDIRRYGRWRLFDDGPAEALRSEHYGRMGLLCGYFTAASDVQDEETIAWIGGPANPPQDRSLVRGSQVAARPTVSLPRIESAMWMGKLEEVLTGRSFDDILRDPAGKIIA
jgi:hypothetical protein